MCSHENASNEIEKFDETQAIVEYEEFDDDLLELGEKVKEIYRTYKKRWYILGVYGAVAFYQGYLWNNWGPIYASMHRYLLWDSSNLSLLTFYECLIATIFVMHSTLLLDRIKLRGIVLFMCMSLTISCAIRCIPMRSHTSTSIIINISAIFVAFPGIVTYFLPAYISSRWFPPKERALATSIGTLAISFGIAFAYLFGPDFVDNRIGKQNISARNIMHEYRNYTYYETAFSCVLTLVVFVYYPSSPVNPPCRTAKAVRTEFWTATKTLLKSKTFWLVSSPTYLVYATLVIWISVLPVDLKNIRITEARTDIVGFYGCLVAAFAGIIAGKVGDWTGDLKAILVALTALTIISTSWLLLILHGIIDYTFRQLTIAAVLAEASASALLPINIELTAEMCYPIGESTIVGAMTFCMSVFNMIFLGILFIPSLGTNWIDYFLMCCCIISLPLVLLIKPQYKRKLEDNLDHN